MPIAADSTGTLPQVAGEFREVSTIDGIPNTTEAFVCVQGGKLWRAVWKNSSMLYMSSAEGETEFVTNPALDGLLARVNSGLDPTDDKALLDSAREIVKFDEENPVTDFQEWAKGLAEASDKFND